MTDASSEWSKEVEKSLASRAASAVDDVEEVKAFTEAAQDEKKEKTGGPKEKNGKKASRCRPFFPKLNQVETAKL